MNWIINIIIFIIVLFFYLHINYHYKTSNDLEIYDLDNPTKDTLEEISELRQPIIFNFHDNNYEFIKRENLLKNYGAFDVKIRNILDNDNETEMYLPLSYKKAIELCNNDKEGKFISESNTDYIDETSLYKIFRANDSFLRPYLTAVSNYDIMFGSEGVSTPLRYDLSYRNYFLVTEGSITIRLTPPKNSKYLEVIKDYDNFEFRSNINLWKIEDKSDNKIKYIDIDLTPNQIIYIPAYWFYSIKYLTKTTICNFKYKSYMNICAIIPEIILKLLQNQNIKRESSKIINNNINSNKNDTLDISNSLIDSL